MPDAPSPALAGAAEVVGLVRRLAEGQGRDDLAAQLDAIRDELVVRPVPVLVVGAPGAGRSSVIDALVGAPVVPVRQPDGAGGTAVATGVQHGASYAARVVPDGPAAGSTHAVDFGEAVALVGGPHNDANRWQLRGVVLEVPAAPLARGLTLVEAPGVAELGSADGLRMVRAMAGVAAVLVVAPADRTLAPRVLDLARTAQAMSRHVVVALTGADRVPRATAATDAAQLALEQRGVSAAVFAVDCRPYWTPDGGVPPGHDPGMRALARHLAESVVLDGEQQRIGRALTEAFWAADRLRLRLWAEEALIEEPGGLGPTIARLRSAARLAERLCAEDAAWRRALGEGARRLAADIGADRHHQLAELAGRLADGTPADRERAVAEAIVRLQRVRALALRAFARQVAGQFRDEWTAVVGSLDLGPEGHSLLLPRLERPGRAAAAALTELPLAGPEDHRLDVGARLDHAFARDTDRLVAHLEDDLATRCRDRAVELHRSLVEVLTALTVLRDADAATRDARRGTLASGLAELDVLEWPGRPVDDAR